jgi:hypothetical protein
MAPTHPTIVPPTQPVAQVHARNTAGTTLKEQRAWPFESSYLDMLELEEYLDERPNLNYRLEVNILFIYRAVLRAASYSITLLNFQSVIEPLLNICSKEPTESFSLPIET